MNRKAIVSVAAMALLLMALLLMPLPPAFSSSTSLMTGALLDLAHFPVFAACSILLCAIFKCQTLKRLAVLFVALLAVAILTEIAQELVSSRTQSFSDLVTDILAITCGMAFYYAASQHRRNGAGLNSATALALSLACLAATIVFHSTPLRTGWVQSREFPTLYASTFPGTELIVESLGALDEVRLETTPQRINITLLKGSPPGVVFWRFRQDWTGYETLQVDIENLDSESADLELNIRDLDSRNDYDDWFNTRASLAGHERRVLTFSIAEILSGPVGRTMDISRMHLIAIARVGGSSDQLAVYSVKLGR